MKKPYLFAIIPFIIALAFYTNVALNPDWVGSDGILHEEFWSKVLWSLFLWIGIISTIVISIRTVYFKNK